MGNYLYSACLNLATNTRNFSNEASLDYSLVMACTSFKPVAVIIWINVMLKSFSNEVTGQSLINVKSKFV